MSFPRARSTSSSRAALLDAEASALASQLKAQQIAEETTLRAKEDELISQQKLKQQKQKKGAEQERIERDRANREATAEAEKLLLTANFLRKILEENFNTPLPSLNQRDDDDAFNGPVLQLNTNLIVPSSSAPDVDVTALIPHSFSSAARPFPLNRFGNRFTQVLNRSLGLFTPRRQLSSAASAMQMSNR